MRHMYITLALILGGFGAILAQETSNAPFTLTELSLDEKSWIREAGFPIASYQFQNQEINSQLQAGLSERKKGKTMSALGWVGAGAGMVLLFIPKDGTSGGGQALAYGSVGMMLGGITLNLVGGSKKRKAQKRVENATYLYESSN